jgi:ribosome biogenesis protein ENP2
MNRTPPSSARRRRPVAANVRLVPLQAQASTTASGRIAAASRDTSSSFGHRRSASTRHQQQQQQQQQQHHDRHNREDEHIHRKGDGSVEVSWVPAPKSSRSGVGEDEDEDSLVGGQQRRQKRALKDTRKGVERFGAGMEKGGEDPNMRALSEQERRGRSQRRRGMRSGSKNAFRQMQA